VPPRRQPCAFVHALRSRVVPRYRYAMKQERSDPMGRLLV
jgi:hypothetical protein